MEQDMQDFAVEARRFLDAHVAKAPDRTAFTWGEGDDSMAYFSSLPPEEEHEHVQRARAWQRIRHENGFGWITGPAEYGGRGLTPVHDLALRRRRVASTTSPTPVCCSVIGLGMVGPTILAHAPSRTSRTATCRRCTAATSSPASCSASPAPAPTWPAWRPGPSATATSGSSTGRRCGPRAPSTPTRRSLLARTDPDAPKHRGITYFLVDMHTPGVEVRPLRQMTGGADFNEVFLTDVRIPDDHRLGEVNGGWTRRPDHPDERARDRRQRGRSARWPPPCPPDRLSALMRHLDLGRPRPARPPRRTPRGRPGHPRTSTPAPCASCAPGSRRAPRCPSPS